MKHGRRARSGHGGRDQAMAGDGGANLFRRVIEVSGEFDFFVADGGSFRQSAVEIGLHLVAHGVELHSEFFYFVFLGGPRYAMAGQHCGG